MIIDCISDLHGHYPELEGGDLLIVAGDCARDDKITSWNDYFNWIDKQNYKKKIMVAGNHDNFCKHWAKAGTFTNDEYNQIYPNEKPTIDYLCDSGTEFEGLKIWGSPWTRSSPDMNPKCKAFTVDTEEELAEKWKLIPNDIDILVTHSPPMYHLDKVNEVTKWGTKQFNVGSESLYRRFLWREIEPKLHVFGHVHEGYGVEGYSISNEKITNTMFNHTVFVNASYVNELYQPINKPVRIIL